MRQYRVTIQPASEPLLKAEVKNHLKVDNTADDDLIDALIVTARQAVEDYTLLKLLPQTVTEYFDGFSDPLELSTAPMRTVSSVTYLDVDGASQTLSTDVYKVQEYALLPLISLKADQVWPTTRAEAEVVTVTYTVGFDDADAVPRILKSAMLLMIGFWYDKREDSIRKMPTQAEFLLRPHRIMI